MLATIPARKRDLIARGMDVIDLGAGDADLAAPPAAVKALADAAQNPAMSRYGFGLGLMGYREAISKWMEGRFGHRFDPVKEIVPLIGSKEGIAHLALAYLEKGDVAIIPDPGYLAYLGGTLLSEAEPYFYPITPRTNFLVELDEIPAEILKRAKILYLNYPNNPTAAVAPLEYLTRVVQRCKALGILLVYDNAYSEMTFDGYVAPSIFDVPGALDVAIEFHSLSKTYNMTGWRCGWACGNAEIVAALTKTKSFLDTGQFMAVQAAGIAALESSAEWVPGNVAIFRERRDAAVAAFSANGFPITQVPKASMYLWAPLPAGISSLDFQEKLMSEEGVIVLGGAALGAGGEGFFRVSFIASPERIAEAARRAGKVLRAMRNIILVAIGVVPACSTGPRVFNGGADREPVVSVARTLTRQGTALNALITAETPPLRSLPQGASYTWIAPSKAFTGVSGKEDAAAPAATSALRETVEIVLQANSWRLVSADSAEYRLSMVRVERSGENVVMRPDPRNGRQPRSTCPRVQITGKTCFEQPPLTYPPVRTVEYYTDRQVGYSIVRASDGATRAMIVPVGKEEALSDLFARLTVELLLSKSP